MGKLLGIFLYPVRLTWWGFCWLAKGFLGKEEDPWILLAFVLIFGAASFIAFRWAFAIGIFIFGTDIWYGPLSWMAGFVFFLPVLLATIRLFQLMEEDRFQPYWGEPAPSFAEISFTLFPKKKKDIPPPVFKFGETTIKENAMFLNCICTGGIGSGKDQRLTARILTPNGWVRMGRIQVGQKVITTRGESATVTAVYPQGRRKTWDITLANKKRTNCGWEHLWIARIDGQITPPTEFNKVFEAYQTGATVELPYLENRETRWSILQTITQYPTEEETQCITIDHPSHLYVTDDGILTHNTATFVYPLCDMLFREYNTRKGRANCGGLMLDVKGEFADSVMAIMRRHGRSPEEDLIVINPDDAYSYRYNPIVPHMNHLQVAGRFRAVLNNLGGGGGDSFWLDSAEKVVANAILLARTIYGRDKANLTHIGRIVADNDHLKTCLDKAKQVQIALKRPPEGASRIERYQFEDDNKNIKFLLQYFEKEWIPMAEQTRSGIVAAVSNQLLRGFTDPKLQRIFCNDTNFSMFDTVGWTDLAKQVHEGGKIVILQAPGWGMTALMIGAALKLDFQQCMKDRILDNGTPSMRERLSMLEIDKDRRAFFICDEYQEYVTCGGKMEGDEGFYAVSRQSRIINAVATQSYESIYSKVGSGNDKAVRVLLQNMRVKIALNGEDSTTAKHIAELCGKNEMSKQTGWSKDKGNGNGLFGGSKNKNFGISKENIYEEWEFYRLVTKVGKSQESSYSEAIIFNGGFTPGDKISSKVKLRPLWIPVKEKQVAKKRWMEERRIKRIVDADDANQGGVANVVKKPTKPTAPNAAPKPSADTSPNGMPPKPTDATNDNSDDEMPSGLNLKRPDRIPSPETARPELDDDNENTDDENTEGEPTQDGNTTEQLGDLPQRPVDPSNVNLGEGIAEDIEESLEKYNLEMGDIQPPPLPSRPTPRLAADEALERAELTIQKQEAEDKALQDKADEDDGVVDPDVTDEPTNGVPINEIDPTDTTSTTGGDSPVKQRPHTTNPSPTTEEADPLNELGESVPFDAFEDFDRDPPYLRNTAKETVKNAIDPIIGTQLPNENELPRDLTNLP